MKGPLECIGYCKETHDEAIEAVRQRGLTEIEDLIDATVCIYERLYGQEAYDINCGNCENFAHDVIRLLGGWTDDLKAVWQDDMKDCTSREVDESHCFIMFNGRFYDSQCSEGVDQWRELPVFASA